MAGGLAQFEPNAATRPKDMIPGTTGNKFLMCMDDDFNTGGAVGALFDALREANGAADILEKHLAQSDLVVATARGVLRYRAQVVGTMANILGLFWQPPQEKELGGGNELVSGLMQLLLDLRNNLRATAKEAAKDNPLKKSLFDQTDLIRKRLGELGVTLEDRPGGTTWRVG
jgi:cysteinyl-tRNA synthetase